MALVFFAGLNKVGTDPAHTAWQGTQTQGAFHVIKSMQMVQAVGPRGFCGFLRHRQPVVTKPGTCTLCTALSTD